MQHLNQILFLIEYGTNSVYLSINIIQYHPAVQKETKKMYKQK